MYCCHGMQRYLCNYVMCAMYLMYVMHVTYEVYVMYVMVCMHVRV